jgi:hypothetical protein
MLQCSTTSIGAIVLYGIFSAEDYLIDKSIRYITDPHDLRAPRGGRQCKTRGFQGSHAPMVMLQCTNVYCGAP